MLEDRWLEQRVGTAYAYNVNQVPESQLLQVCVEDVLDMIRRYRPGENPEQYRSAIEEKVKRRIEQ